MSEATKSRLNEIASTCATGAQPGSQDLLDHAVRLAADWKVPLRVIRWLPWVTADPTNGARSGRNSPRQHATLLADKATAALPADATVSSVVGQGDSLEAAVQALEFDDNEVVLIGSSRLAQPKRLFLGHSASKILRALPVPMIVLPRD